MSGPAGCLLSGDYDFETSPKIGSPISFPVWHTVASPGASPSGAHGATSCSWDTRNPGGGKWKGASPPTWITSPSEATRDLEVHEVLGPLAVPTLPMAQTTPPGEGGDAVLKDLATMVSAYPSSTSTHSENVVPGRTAPGRRRTITIPPVTTPLRNSAMRITKRGYQKCNVGVGNRFSRQLYKHVSGVGPGRKSLKKLFGAAPWEHWKTFRDKVRVFCDQHENVPVPQLHLLLASSLRGVAKRATHWLIYGREYVTISKLMEAYDLVFSPSGGVEDYRLQQCTLQRGESVSQFHQRVIQLYGEVYVGFNQLPIELKGAQQGHYSRIFLQGLNCPALMKAVLSQRPSSYSALLGDTEAAIQGGNGLLNPVVGPRGEPRVVTLSVLRIEQPPANLPLLRREQLSDLTSPDLRVTPIRDWVISNPGPNHSHSPPCLSIAETPREEADGELAGEYSPCCSVMLHGLETTALLDSGNQVCEMLSEKWAQKRWGEDYHYVLEDPPPTPIRMGTALQNAPMTIVGQLSHSIMLQWMTHAPGETGMILIPSQQLYPIRPVVVRGLEGDLHLSGTFLIQNQVDHLHSMDLILVDGMAISTLPYQGLPRIMAIYEEEKDSTLPEEVFPKQEQVALTHDKCTLKAQAATYVPLRLPTPGQEGVLKLGPKFRNKYGHPPTDQIYIRADEKGMAWVPILNATDRSRKIPKGTEVGKVKSWVPPVLEPYLASLYRNSRGNPKDIKPHLSNPMVVGGMKERIQWLEREFKLDEAPWINQDPEGRKKALKLLLCYYDVFSQNDEYGHTQLIQHEIHTTRQGPVRLRGKPIPKDMYDNLQEQMDVWIKQGVIEPSQSPWSFGLLPVAKKNGKIRWVVDFRGLNTLTLKDSFPLPNIEDNLSRLAHSKVFSALDGTGAYHVITIREKDRPKTAFHTPFGQYQFRQMPFGLCNAPATYSRLVQKVMAGISPEVALTYLDDTCVHTSNLDIHLETLAEIFKAYRAAGLMLQPSKCQLFQKEVGYLGHIVTKDGIKPVPAYVQLVQEWEMPRSLREWRTFLGKVAYYRKFIERFSHLSAPLYSLVKDEGGPTPNDIPIGEKEVRAFNLLKTALNRAPTLVYPDFKSTQPFILTVDFSPQQEAMGGKLSQRQKGHECTILYGSKKLGGAELQYEDNKGELLAVTFFIKLWRYYFEQRGFLLRMRPEAMEWFRTLPSPKGMLLRWEETLANYQFKLLPVNTWKTRTPLSEQQLQKMCQIGTWGPRTGPLTRGVGAESGSKTLVWYQQTDSILAKVRLWIQQGQPPLGEEISHEGRELKDYLSIYETCEIGEDQILKRRVLDNGAYFHPRDCIPQELQAKAIQGGHEQTGRHMDLEQTIARLNHKCYFPEMDSRITLYVANCRQCRQAKEFPVHWGQGATFNRLIVEQLGPLTRSQQNNYYLTILVDFDTRWLEAYPCQTASIREMAQQIEVHIVDRYGPPDLLVTLPDAKFSTRRLKDLGRVLQINVDNSDQGEGPPCLLEKREPAWEILLQELPTKDMDWRSYSPPF